MCPDAYREALMRDIRRRANPEEDGPERRGVAPAGAAAGPGPAIALVEDAAVDNGEPADRR
jgi:hypothetical protein